MHASSGMHYFCQLHGLMRAQGVMLSHFANLCLLPAYWLTCCWQSC